VAIPVYDSLVRHAFGSPDTARELTQNLLPQPYVDMIAGAEVTVSSAAAELLYDRTERRRGSASWNGVRSSLQPVPMTQMCPSRATALEQGMTVAFKIGRAHGLVKK
jgi:hypothetical protein